MPSAQVMLLLSLPRKEKKTKKTQMYVQAQLCFIFPPRMNTLKNRLRLQLNKTCLNINPFVLWQNGLSSHMSPVLHGS